MLTAMDPPVRISVNSCVPGAQAGHWRVRWLVQNATDAPVSVEDAWVPHGRFRGDGHVALAATIEAGGSHLLELGVSAAEPPGSVVENAFLILRVHTEARGWRVFARMRIDFDESGSARPAVETLTAQPL
jgi:hypothetical protein